MTIFIHNLANVFLKARQDVFIENKNPTYVDIIAGTDKEIVIFVSILCIGLILAAFVNFFIFYLFKFLFFTNGKYEFYGSESQTTDKKREQIEEKIVNLFCAQLISEFFLLIVSSAVLYQIYKIKMKIDLLNNKKFFAYFCCFLTVYFGIKIYSLVFVAKNRSKVDISAKIYDQILSKSNALLNKEDTNQKIGYVFEVFMNVGMVASASCWLLFVLCVFTNYLCGFWILLVILCAYLLPALIWKSSAIVKEDDDDISAWRFFLMFFFQFDSYGYRDELPDHWKTLLFLCFGFALMCELVKLPYWIQQSNEAKNKNVLKT